MRNSDFDILYFGVKKSNSGASVRQATFLGKPAASTGEIVIGEATNKVVDVCEVLPGTTDDIIGCTFDAIDQNLFTGNEYVQFTGQLNIRTKYPKTPVASYTIGSLPVKEYSVNYDAVQLEDYFGFEVI